LIWDMALKFVTDLLEISEKAVVFGETSRDAEKFTASSVGTIGETEAVAEKTVAGERTAT
jgi:hypothetical protein